ncbi:DoxX family membrane protein [Leekyejoonella antrihumi]|uniref:DoxX family membrane protein n=2 Tax=Leekyejoonella antrihumi TaxID=1660198 RepID=A0A563DUS3_9MICO|nr:DoxX family membrane protein [Leekyejoonella antrihumi]
MTMRSAHVQQPSDLGARLRNDPAYGAYWLLRIGFVVLPLWMGIDKFAKVLNVNWPGYLAPWIVHLLPFSAQTAMYVVGAVEILAGILVALKPRYASYVVALWLAGIVINLLTYSGFYDIALRDFGLLIGALALARLAAKYDQAWTRVMRTHDEGAITE